MFEEKRPVPKGRGALLYQTILEKQKLSAQRQQEQESTPVRIGRGRATQLEKLTQLCERQASTPSTSSSRGTFSTSNLLKKLAPARISKTDDTLSESESLREPVIKRATPGKNDTIIPATANYIRLNVESGKGVFEYEVRYKPEIDHRGLKSKILGQYLKGPKTFDGVVLYLPAELPEPRTTFIATHPINESEVEVLILFKRKKRLGECIHLYNVMFRRIFKMLHYAQIGRQMFDPRKPHRIPQHKLEIWPGYVTAVDEYEGGIMLCIDCSHRVLRTDTVRSFLTNIVASRNARGFQQEATKALVGTSVLTKYNNKLYKIDDIIWDENPASTFTTSSGAEISYVEYYKKQYDLQIEDFQQPLLVNRAKRRVGTQQVDQLVCLIPELCYMTGLSEEMRCNFTLMKDVATYTRITPNQRIAALNRFIENVRNCSEAQTLLNSWGLSLASGTIDLEMRTLPPETILFGGNRSVAGTRQADWTRSAASNPVISAMHLNNWYILFTPQDKRNAEQFKDVIMHVCGPMGLKVSPPQTYCLQNDATGTYVEALNRIIQPTVQIIVIICPTMRDDRYSVIKKICCADKPIPSQVINSRTLSNPKKVRTIVQKILLQMNCKLGGQLWAVNLPKNRWMICGIDAFHDAQRASGRSVAAFVASINAQITRWYSQANYQSKGEELCNALKTLFTSALKKFFDVNGDWPSHVFIYRDGVGDGQLKFCKEYEIPQLQEAMNALALNPERLPRITFIVVQKRINTRLFLRNFEENPAPGTIMDNTITRRDWFDFFLVPQCVRQGTVSPTHYVVIQDQSDLSVDHVQKLTYKMCHLYYNWTGTIRVPAPCQYAHKLAYLVGQNVHKVPSEELADRLYYL